MFIFSTVEYVFCGLSLTSSSELGFRANTCPLFLEKKSFVPKLNICFIEDRHVLMNSHIVLVVSSLCNHVLGFCLTLLQTVRLLMLVLLRTEAFSLSSTKITIRNETPSPFHSSDSSYFSWPFASLSPLLMSLLLLLRKIEISITIPILC